MEAKGILACSNTSVKKLNFMCQAGNEKLQHFRGEARAKIPHGNLLQCKSALSPCEIVCNKFPADAVSASNCFYCILKAFHTFKFFSAL